MKAKELRSGNIVHYQIEDAMDERKKWKEENIIDGGDIASIEGYEVVKGKHPYFPIPLTEEWIEKLGFHAKDDDGMWYHPKEELFEIQNLYLETLDGSPEKFDFIWDSTYAEAPMKYVHQLQNLFYAMTGEELVLAVRAVTPKRKN